MIVNQILIFLAHQKQRMRIPGSSENPKLHVLSLLHSFLSSYQAYDSAYPFATDMPHRYILPQVVLTCSDTQCGTARTNQ
jgi:hypothetical protein